MAFRFNTGRLKQTLSIIGIVLSVMGIVTFSLFIFEESFQTIMFGTWAAQDAQNWPLVKHGLDSMSGVVLTMKILNYSIGWVQPFAFLSYRAYGIAADYYILALKAKVMAHQPELFVNEKILVEFVPNRIEKAEEGSFTRFGKIQIVTPKLVLNSLNSFSGILRQKDGRLWLEMRGE